jgi:hypothetical protein
MINNLLAKAGIDLNNIVGFVIDMQATVVRPKAADLFRATSRLR